MTVWQSIKSGIGLLLKNIGKTEGVLILFTLFQALITFLYWKVEGTSGMISPMLIVAFFAVQQLLIFFRILWRIAAYRGIEFLMNKTLTEKH